VVDTEKIEEKKILGLDSDAQKTIEQIDSKGLLDKETIIPFVEQ
jgi:hypothetical protein